MSDTKYNDALTECLLRIGELHKQRMAIDSDLSKLRNLARATINMLPDEQQANYTELLDSFYQDADVGLKESIANILMASHTWMSPVAVRDALFQQGFNFDSYTSNPLASIHTVLKRFSPEKVETRSKDGVTEYHWKGVPLSSLTVGALFGRTGNTLLTGKTLSAEEAKKAVAAARATLMKKK